MSCPGVRQEPWRGLARGESRGLQEYVPTVREDEFGKSFSNIGGGNSFSCNLKNHKIYC